MIPSDPNMLLSYINLKLRDNYASLENLIDDLDLDPAELNQKLENAGIVYDAGNNQLKFK